MERNEKLIQNQLHINCPNKQNVNIELDAGKKLCFLCEFGMCWSLALLYMYFYFWMGTHGDAGNNRKQIK